MTTQPSPEKPARHRSLTQIIALRIEPELYEAIFLEAVKERRSLSGWVRMVVLDRLAADVETQK